MRTWTGFMAGLVILGLAGCSDGPTPAATKRFPFAAGATLGQAMAAELEEGEPVLVVGRWNDEFPTDPLVAAFASGLEQGLKKVSATVSVVNVPLHPEYEKAAGVVQANAVKKALGDHAGSRALVFCHVKPSRVSKAWPPIYSMTPFECPNEDDPFPAYARMVVCYRAGIDWTAQPDPSLSDEEVFDTRFRLRRAAEEGRP